MALIVPVAKQAKLESKCKRLVEENDDLKKKMEKLQRDLKSLRLACANSSKNPSSGSITKANQFQSLVVERTKM